MKNELEEKGLEHNLPDKKEQTTVYMSTVLLDKIEEKLSFIRQKLPRSKRVKLTKSKFYEMLIESVIADDKQLNKIINRLQQN